MWRELTLPVKEGNLSCIFKQKETDIALLQETHLDPVESKKLQSDWVGQIFFTAHYLPKHEGFKNRSHNVNK